MNLPSGKKISFSIFFLFIILLPIVYSNGENLESDNLNNDSAPGNISNKEEATVAAIPFEFTEQTHAIFTQPNVNLVAMESIMHCLRESTGFKLLFLAKEKWHTEILEKIGVQKDEMALLKNGLNAHHNNSMIKFIHTAPENLGKIIYDCVQKFSPTMDKENCCKMNNSVPSVCTQLCTSRANISEELNAKCEPHFDGIAQCYPENEIEMRSAIGDFLCTISPNCIKLIQGGVYVGSVGAISENPVIVGVGAALLVAELWHVELLGAFVSRKSKMNKLSKFDTILM